MEFREIIDTPRSQLRYFTTQYYEDITFALEKRRLGLAEFFLNRTDEYPFDLNDAYSCDSCKLACSSLQLNIYLEHGVTRNGGVIFLMNGKLVEYGPHAYLSSIEDPSILLDFSAGQFALTLGLSLDHWIQQYQELFIGRALFGDKREIKEKLGIHYPDENIPFENYFGY